MVVYKGAGKPDTIALHPLHVHDQTFRIVLTESRLSMGRTPLTLPQLIWNLWKRFSKKILRLFLRCRYGIFPQNIPQPGRKK